MKILLVMSLIMLAFVVGMIAPDVDQKVGLIVHRSILTHGPWFALAAILLATKSNSRYAIPLTGAAFSLGLSIHLAADLFPRGWTGFALIHIPGMAACPGQPASSGSWHPSLSQYPQSCISAGGVCRERNTERAPCNGGLT